MYPIEVILKIVLKSAFPFCEYRLESASTHYIDSVKLKKIDEKLQ